MTSDARTLVQWGGTAAAVALLGLVWVVLRGGTLADNQAKVRALTAEQAKAQPNGLRLDQQIAAIEKSAQDQGRALEQASGKLVPPLHPEYLVADDLSSAANRVATDLKALRQRAERTRVTLPPSLPLESGLDADAAVRGLQLAQLSLYRQALDTLMDAGITRISTLTPGRAWADPSGTYAIITADIDIEAPYEAVQAAFQGFIAAHKQGLGLRAAGVTPGLRADAPMRVKLTASLLVANHAEWKLVPDKPAPATYPAARTGSTSPAAQAATPQAGAKPGGKPSLGD